MASVRTNVAQMYDKILEPIRGWWADGALECEAPLSANVTMGTVNAGRVVHLNSSKEFEMGAVGHEMPIVLMRGSDEADSQVDRDPVHGVYSVPNEGKIVGLVCTGGFEVATPYFDANQTYNPNDLLTAQAGNDSSTTGGVLTNSGVTAGAVNVCGVVSQGVVASKHTGGGNLLQWWTYFLPIIP